LSGPVRADAIVVAAGRSERMGGTDKLAAEIGGRPLLAWSLAAIAAAPEVERIVVVAAPDRVAALSGAPWLPAAVIGVVPGGERRQESVAAGFAALAGGPADDERVVLVHDGARPAVTSGLVSAVARAAAEHGAAIPVLPVAETLKRVAGGRVGSTVERDDLVSAQTPQGVRHGLLARAFALRPPDGVATFTDEAALLEACGIPVHVIPGEPGNLKVTLPDDLRRAEFALLGSVADRTVRIGFGSDSHPFGPGEPLALGGLRFAGAPRLYGHSDGDVVLHAIADALLGAAGLGDLGRVFPSDARTPLGIASGELVREVVRRVADAGFRPTSVDVTVIAARPRLAGRLDDMCDAVAALLGLPADAVNIKASTGNLAGMEGAGRGISAHAAALVAALA
jgi:2-C-methyl-D-erythritol 4-phosphate cytidylyltransferase/2-C-methyl-D-erythritol 2,4-cyclodiphosphate synthase